MPKLFKSMLSYTLGAILVFSFVALAGTLTPGEGVTTSTTNFYTLSDIYSKIQNINYTASTHTVSTSSSPAGTFNTLSQVYTLLDNLDYTASDIATGTTIMGIDGTAYVITGTGTGSIATADQIITDYYAYSATGTVIQGAATAGTPALVWSADDPAGPVDGWSAAVAYCAGLGGGYRLPYVEELIAETSIGNPSFTKFGGFTGGSYWSGVTDPYSEDLSAHSVDMTGGHVFSNDKTFTYNYARCVR